MTIPSSAAGGGAAGTGAAGGQRRDPTRIGQRTGVPVTPFPGWMRCPRCHRLGPLDPPGQFELYHKYGRRPDLAKYVHGQCSRQTGKRPVNRRACIPACFVVVCEDGHLDDFPYVEYVHATRTQGVCAGPMLTMSDAASTIVPLVTIKCVACDHSRSIQDATGRDKWESLPSCRGRRPHLGRFNPGCVKRLRLMVLGASNLWFPVAASALHLPSEQTLEDLVVANWEVLGELPSAGLAQKIIEGMGQLRSLRGFPIDDVWGCIEKIRGAGGPASSDEPDNLRDLSADGATAVGRHPPARHSRRLRRIRGPGAAGGGVVAHAARGVQAARTTAGTRRARLSCGPPRGFGAFRAPGPRAADPLGRLDRGGIPRHQRPLDRRGRGGANWGGAHRDSARQFRHPDRTRRQRGAPRGLPTRRFDHAPS